MAALLGGQTSWLSSLLPAGIASFLGWSGYERAREPEPVYVAPKRETPSWLIPAIVLGGILLAVIGWLLGRPTLVPEPTVAARAVAKVTDLQLPGGLKVTVPEGSINYSLYQWLAGTTDTTVPKRFVFDNLNFETASTQLTSNSIPTVDSLVMIMKAYPNVAVRLEGHTDNTGDAGGEQEALVRPGCGRRRSWSRAESPTRASTSTATDRKNPLPPTKPKKAGPRTGAPSWSWRRGDLRPVIIVLPG